MLYLYKHSFPIISGDIKYKLINSVYVHVWVQLLLSQNILGIVKARVCIDCIYMYVYV